MLNLSTISKIEKLIKILML